MGFAPRNQALFMPPAFGRFLSKYNPPPVEHRCCYVPPGSCLSNQAERCINLGKLFGMWASVAHIGVILGGSTLLPARDGQVSN